MCFVSSSPQSHRSHIHINTRIDHTHTPPTGQGKEYLVRASFLEIYNEDIRDLLAKPTSNTFGHGGSDQQQRLELKEQPDKGVYVKDLTHYVVKTIHECQELLMV